MSNRPRETALAPLVVCAAVHLLADLVLVSRGWYLQEQLLLAASAFPLSQCSLVALWAATSRTSNLLRYAAPVVGVIGSWYVLAQIFPWGIGDPTSAAWALALVGQTLTVVIATELCQAVGRRGRPEARHSKPQHFRFGLQTLILWTTVIAVGFGFIHYGQTHWSWTTSTDWRFVTAIALIGQFNAGIALLWSWALAVGHWRWRVLKIVIVAVLVGSLATALPIVIGLFTFNVEIDINMLLWAAAQSLLLVATLAVVVAAWPLREQSTQDSQD